MLLGATRDPAGLGWVSLHQTSCKGAHFPLTGFPCKAKFSSSLFTEASVSAWSFGFPKDVSIADKSSSCGFSPPTCVPLDSRPRVDMGSPWEQKRTSLLPVYKTDISQTPACAAGRERARETRSGAKPVSHGNPGLILVHVLHFELETETTGSLLRSIISSAGFSSK